MHLDVFLLFILVYSFIDIYLSFFYLSVNLFLPLSPISLSLYIYIYTMFSLV